RGKIIIGTVTGAPPFGTIDEKGNPAGYDIDVANLIGKYLGVQVEIQPQTTAARIPALQAHKVDMLVATLAPTPERAKQVMFTMPYNAFQMMIMAPKSAKIATLNDLAGLSVSVPR